MQNHTIAAIVYVCTLLIFFVPVNATSAATSLPHTATIMQIQGNSQFSEYANDLVETTGVVTLYTKNGANFWMQDPDGDGFASTSDGIFVSGGGFPQQGVKPKPGDFIRIVAQVQEQQFGSALPLTRLRRVKYIKILSSQNQLPEAIELSLLPAQSIEQGIVFWESLEGMLVKSSDANVVAPTTRFGEFAMINEANQDIKSGYYSDSGHLLIRSTGEQQVDYNPERILVDDASLQSTIIVRPGDEMKSLVAVVDYSFGNYKLQPVHYELELNSESKVSESEYNFENSSDTSSEYKKSENKNNLILSLVSFNVENLFDLVDNPNKNDHSSTPTKLELETKLDKLAIAVQQNLEIPDIIVVQEIENTEILQMLADRINSQSLSQYASVSLESSDRRGIEVGLMWNKARVKLKTYFQMEGIDVENAFGISSTSPGREPLVGVFDFYGTEITIVGNHFKSKGGDDVIFGINQPPKRNSEIQRKLQAQVVRNFVDRLLMENPDANIAVTGDLNDFQFAEPGEGKDHPIGILEGTIPSLALFNLIAKLNPAQRFSFVFDGNSQLLDHMLVSPALLERFNNIFIPHFNTNAPTIMVNDPTSPNRSSDHDPVWATFHFK